MRQDEMIAPQIRRKIAEMLQCRMSGEIGRLLRFFDPHALVHCASSREGLLAPGVWEGVEAFGFVTRLNDENYQPLDYEILDIVVDGNQAAVRWRGAWRRHATGKIYMKDAANFLRWENGLVVEMHEFFEHTSYSKSHYNRISNLGLVLTEKPPTFDRGEIERRVRELFVCASNDLDGHLIRELCSPDVLCDFVGDRARIPYAGRHVGVEALINIVRSVVVDFEQCDSKIFEILVEQDRIAGCRRVEWRHRGTGSRGLVDLATFARFEGGLIVELVEFRDVITMLEMRGEMGDR